MAYGRQPIKNIMVNSLTKPEAADLRNDVKMPAKETILTPRFYTTDFEEMERMDISYNEEEMRAIIAEFKVDYNRHHFVRDEQFDNSWDSIDGETRQLFSEFLERSCTAEFSGFLLYKELGRRLKKKNPLLAEGFNLMSRDEARHAGFLNKAMADFDMSLDLGFLTQNHQYTFFKPKFIFYATYLSEKIGYWRYIKIFRHLEAHPENKLYPLFNYFENWCQDENRHGDFFDAVMKSQPHILNDLKARLWCRFFLLSVFATMYLNDHQRTRFYESMGMNTRDFNLDVIKETNWTAGRIFPIILDVNNPKFTALLDKSAASYLKIVNAPANNLPKFLKIAKNLPHIAAIGWNMVRLYAMKPIDTAKLEGTVR
jgi:magnesium-protoporphyrin IX monomethyl ester (oxidative) cyclase